VILGFRCGIRSYPQRFSACGNGGQRFTLTVARTGSYAETSCLVTRHPGRYDVHLLEKPNHRRARRGQYGLYHRRFGFETSRRFLWDTDGYKLQDLDSTNGTRVNGEPITEAKLNNGDTVAFGDIETRYEAPVAKPRPPLSIPRHPAA